MEDGDASSTDSGTVLQRSSGRLCAARWPPSQSSGGARCRSSPRASHLARRRCIALQLSGHEAHSRLIPLHALQADSERLLQQTAEAQGTEFSLKGVYDVRAWVAAACDERRLAAAQLSAILSTLGVS